MLAHVNLNDEYLPYKYLIGQVFLDVRNRMSCQAMFQPRITEK